MLPQSLGEEYIMVVVEQFQNKLTYLKGTNFRMDLIIPRNSIVTLSVHIFARMYFRESKKFEFREDLFSRIKAFQKFHKDLFSRILSFMNFCEDLYSRNRP